MFKSMCLLVTFTANFTAWASEPAQKVNLQSDLGLSFSVEAKVLGIPNGLKTDVVLTDVVTAIEGTTSADNVEVVYLNDCENYNGDRFTAYLSCAASYDSGSGKSLAKLDMNACRSENSRESLRFNFESRGGWYVLGRTGYYQAQYCTPRVAVRVNDKWARDPITDSSNFGVILDYRQVCPQGCY